MKNKVYLILLLTLLVIGCNKDRGKLLVSDFNKSDSITVKPYKLYPYTMFNLKIKGYANDTIRIKTKGIYNLDLKLIGNIDTLWFSDYYGEGKFELIFIPYKASKGKLEIEMAL